MSNNQSHELRLFETLMARVEELQELDGLDRLKIELHEWGFFITIEEESQFEVVYWVGLYIYRTPLRVEAKNANDSQKGPKPFRETRKLLQRLIQEIESQICWATRDAQIEEQGPDYPDEREEGEPERFTEVNLGDDAGGFKIYE